MRKFKLIAILLTSIFSANAAAQQNKNTYTFNRNYDNYQESYFASIKRNDDSWEITSINERKTTKDKDEEILLIKKTTSGWQFNPYFKYTNPRNPNGIWCVDDRPHGISNEINLIREENTNICNSRFVTSTPPSSHTFANVVGYGLFTVFTAGIGAVAIANMKESQRYIDFDAIKKAVEDTKLDELLSSLEPIRQAHLKRIKENQEKRDSIANNLKTNFIISDLSGGFGKNLNLDSAQNLVTYSSLKILDTLKLPKNLNEIDNFKAASETLLSDLTNKKITVKVRCKIGNSTIGIFNVSIYDCPSELEIENPKLDAVIPIKINSINANITPTISIADKILSTSLTSKGLVISNQTDDFIDLNDISVSINGKIRTISGNGKPLITIPPKSTYPRENENGKFPLNELIDKDMNESLSFKELTLNSAKQKFILINLSIRYSFQNTTKTLRGNKNLNVFSALQ